MIHRERNFKIQKDFIDETTIPRRLSQKKPSKNTDILEMKVISDKIIQKEVIQTGKVFLKTHFNSISLIYFK
jgi:hypothetical protein